MCLKVCATTLRNRCCRDFALEAAAAVAQTTAVNILRAAATLRRQTAAARAATAILLPAPYARMCAAARSDDDEEEKEEEDYLPPLDWLWISALLGRFFCPSRPPCASWRWTSWQALRNLTANGREVACHAAVLCNPLSCRAVLDNEDNSIDAWLRLLRAEYRNNDNNDNNNAPAWLGRPPASARPTL